MSDPIELETLASSPRPYQNYTNDPDASINRSDGPDNVGPRSPPPDAHPPDNVNSSQSSQEVDRMPSPRLHREAREPAGSQPALVPRLTRLWRRQDSEDYWDSVGWAEDQCIAAQHPSCGCLRCKAERSRNKRRERCMFCMGVALGFFRVIIAVGVVVWILLWAGVLHGR